MATFTVPGVGIVYNWETDEHGWAEAMNNNLVLLGAMARGRVEARNISDPPATPAASQAWIVPVGATGDWSAFPGHIAVWNGTTWLFVAPSESRFFWDAGAGELISYSGGTWGPFTAGIEEAPADGTQYTRQDEGWVEIPSFRGALVSLGSNINSASFPLIIPWDSTEYDTDSFWQAGNPTRLTVPAGVSKVRLIAGVGLEPNTSAGTVYLSIRKNGVPDAPGMFNGIVSPRNYSIGYTNNESFTATPVLQVSEGDYFEVRINHNMTASVDTVESSPSSFFAIEAIE